MVIDIIVYSEMHVISELIRALVILLGLQIAQDVTAIIFERSRTHLGIQIQRYFNVKIMEKAAKVSFEMFDTPDYYKNYTDAQRVLGGRWDVLVYAPFELISILINVIGVGAIIFNFNQLMFIVVLLGLIPKIITDIKARKERHRFHSEEIPEVRKYNYINGILTNKDALKEIRIYNLVGYLIDQYKSLYDSHFVRFRRLLDASYIRKSYSTIRKSYSTVLYTIFIVSIEAYLVIQVFLKKLTLANYQLLTW